MLCYTFLEEQQCDITDNALISDAKQAWQLIYKTQRESLEVYLSCLLTFCLLDISPVDQ